MDSAALEEMITIGIDIFPTIFRMKSKVLGEHNENVNYIAEETGALISLRGKGSGYNLGDGRNHPLHLFVKYRDIESKPRARQLILSLIGTVQKDFIETYGKYYHRPKKPEISPVFPNSPPSITKERSPPSRMRVPSPIARPRAGGPLSRQRAPNPLTRPRGLSATSTSRVPSPEPRPRISSPVARAQRTPSPVSRPQILSPIGRRRKMSPKPRKKVFNSDSRPRGPNFVQKPKIPNSVPRHEPQSPVYRLNSLSPPPRARHTSPSTRLMKSPSPHWERRNSISPPVKDVTGVTAMNDNIEKMVLGLDQIPFEFNLKTKVYGQNLSNVKHIEKVTGALLLLEGYAPSSVYNAANKSPYLLIKYVKPDFKEKARSLIFNLIETIHDEFKSLFPTLSRSVRKPEIVPFINEAGSMISSMTSRITNTEDLMSLKRPSWDISTSAKRSVSPISRENFTVDITPVPPPPPVISKVQPMTAKPSSLSRQSVYDEKAPSVSVSNNRKPIISPEEISEFLNAMKPALSKPKPVIDDFPPTTAVQPSYTHTSIERFLDTTDNNNSIPLITLDDSSTQTLNSQYFKKRSNSPIDKLHEPKKFCNATNSNSVTANTFLNSTPASFIADMTIPPPGWDLSGVELTNQTPAPPPPPPQPVKTNPKIASRCLVEIPQVNLSAKPKPQASQQTPFLREEPSKMLAPSPKATMTAARKLNKISFSINNSNAKSNGALSVSDVAGKCLNEEDDGKSVIVIDLEEEAERERMMAAESSENSNSISASTRTVASQTDVFLSRPYLKCACGRYTPSVNSARSCSTQTNLWG